ncbi:hypothetical protein BX616_001847 [Lobosporangium transversale]|uniref:Uncharacterized protein n=1 Tax=Lobosporangium transversale TaxID=64571 RepID=A0A1Y2GC22_9FUNG|nr:hypothetical protein BCR41DRAFT_375199 [Lobosporangium transversale]KAF9902707.1 hypothetical protein BX616_001847 [Lobosporangium transversale]ORZ01972.1 hypothetical protein BCR41DRAFT_375199 [Lobosporangium transversale]|eukprot:XP_021876225.1 hypothetical protein BCR41DRAFT_375199 [Lobosporangium transversale]
MLVSAQSLHKFGCFAKAPTELRKSSGSYHRRTVSCLAIAAHHGHYNRLSYYASNGYFYDAIGPAEGSISPVNQARHVKRRSEGAISIELLQKSLLEAGIKTKDVSSTAEIVVGAKHKTDADASRPLNGRLVKLAVPSFVSVTRRSLLSDLLSNQGTSGRLEQNANRRRILKSMRQCSVDANEVDLSVDRPSTCVVSMGSIPSGEESSHLVDDSQAFIIVPTIRHIHNPCHAAIKTKLQSLPYRALARRSGADEDDEAPDYFGIEDRVW